MASIPRDRFAKEPAEGSREIVDRELKRREAESTPAATEDPDRSNRHPGAEGPDGE